MCYFTHQMWCDDPFSQKKQDNRKSNGGWGQGLEATGKGAWTKF